MHTMYTFLRFTKNICRDIQGIQPSRRPGPVLEPFSGGVQAYRVYSLCVLTKGRHGSTRTCNLHCTLTPAACAARSARSAPGQDTRSGQGALARRHTDGPLWAALLKTTVMCEAWRRRTIAPPDPPRTADRPNPILLITGSSIPIPVPGQYRLPRCLK
jgi:hypothetical protein